jgi:hypothetical protein
LPLVPIEQPPRVVADEAFLDEKLLGFLDLGGVDSQGEREHFVVHVFQAPVRLEAKKHAQPTLHRLGHHLDLRVRRELVVEAAPLHGYLDPAPERRNEKGRAGEASTLHDPGPSARNGSMEILPELASRENLTFKTQIIMMISMCEGC